MLCIGQVVLWYGLHPRGDGVPLFVSVSLAALKLLGLVGLMYQFAAVHAGIGTGRIGPVRVVVDWTVALLVLLLLLGYGLDPIGVAFETIQTHLVRPSEEIGYPVLGEIVSEEQLRHRHFVRQWHRGEILAIEASMALILALVHVWAARRTGSRAGPVSVLVANASAAWIWVHINCFFQLTLLTYDTFYLGSMAGPLLVDALVPWVLYPTTPLAVPFYATLSVACWWRLRMKVVAPIA